MPQVPRLSQQQVQGVNPNFKVSADAPLSAFGGGRTRDVVFNQIADMTEKIKNNADDVAILDAEKQLSDWENEFMYGENGAAKRQGKNAFPLKKELDDSFALKKDEIIGKLSSDSQKAKFTERSTGRKISLDRQVMQHVGNEVQRYDDQATKDYLSSEMNAAISNYQNPERVAESLYRQETEMMKFADRHGLPAESAKAEIQRLRSGTHSGIINKMLDNGDDISAENYYKANAESLLESDKGKIEQAIEIGSTKGKSQRFVDQAMAKGMDEKQAYAEAAKTFGNKPRIREAAESRIARQFDLKRQGERDEQERLLEEATKYVDSGKGDYVPTTLINRLNKESRESFDKYRDRNPILDDGVMFHQYMTMASDPKTRAEFQNQNLLLDKRFLSAPHFEKLRQYQIDLREGKDSAGKELDGAFSDAQIIQSKFEDAGFKAETGNKEWSKFKLKVDDEIIKHKKATGKTFLNNSEIAEIAGKETAEYVLKKGWIFDTKKPNFMIDVNEDIPDQDRANIIEALKKTNKPITDEAILKLYLLKVNK